MTDFEDAKDTAEWVVENISEKAGWTHAKALLKLAKAFLKYGNTMEYVEPIFTSFLPETVESSAKSVTVKLPNGFTAKEVQK